MTTQALICWLNMNKDKVPPSLHPAISELSRARRDTPALRPLNEALVDAIANKMCNKTNDFNAPYFQGYKEHAVELVQQIDSEVRMAHGSH